MIYENMKCVQIKEQRNILGNIMGLSLTDLSLKDISQKSHININQLNTMLNNNSNMKWFFSVFLIPMIFEGCCLPGHNYCPQNRISFRVYNYSDANIVTLLMSGTLMYPDTMLPELSDKWDWYPTQTLQSDYHEFYKEENRDTLCLFILSPDTIAKYGWDKVREDYNILARYDLCVVPSELRKLDFKVSYPPAEVMKDVKMYPSYDYLTSMIPNVSDE